MKKNFQLKVEGKDSARVLESIKNEIRKYIKREKRKQLPENMHYWYFYCAFGQNSDEPKEILFKEITANIDKAATAGCDSFFLELTASPQKKVKREREEDTAEVAIDMEDENQE